MNKMKIEYLADNKWAIPIIAKLVFENMKLFRDDDLLETMVAKYEKLAHKGTIPFTLVAFEEKYHVLGTASVVIDNMPNEPNSPPWLAAVYVDNKYRKKGIGSALVKKVLEETGRLGVETIYLFTNKGFRPVFYKKLGWKIIKNITYKGVNKVVMIFNFKANMKIDYESV